MKQLVYSSNFTGSSYFPGSENFDIYIKSFKIDKEIRFSGNVYDSNGKARVKGLITFDMKLIVYEQKYSKEPRESNPLLNEVIHYEFK